MRKCCSSSFGISPVIQENNPGSRNVSLCSRGPLSSPWCHSLAPQGVLPSGEDALTIPTFKSGLTAPEPPAGLMRLFLQSCFLWIRCFPASPSWGTLEAASTFLSTVPKLPRPCAWCDRNRGKVNTFPLLPP